MATRRSARLDAVTSFVGSAAGANESFGAWFMAIAYTDLCTPNTVADPKHMAIGMALTKRNG